MKKFIVCIWLFCLAVFTLVACGGSVGGDDPVVQVTPPIPQTMIPQTGQSVCYDLSSRMTIPCNGTGQDGETRAGAPWPNPRFSPSTQGLSLDELTGLEWTTDRNAPGPVECLPVETKTWDEALNYIACINQASYLGHVDWRLPNIVELGSLFNAHLDTSFSDQLELGAWGYWWSSTTRGNDTTVAYSSLAESGWIYYRPKTDLCKVWPVRSGEAGTILLPRTGQTTCYDSSGITINCTGTGQDGDVLAGREWPEPRFSDNGDETMTDNLTELIWTKKADYPYSEVCTPGSTDFPSSINYIKCLNANIYLGYDDWRLPNEFELRSLSNYNLPSNEKSNWLNGYGFYNLPYWISSWSSTVNDEYGFFRDIWVGGGVWEFDYTNGQVWPVRGGIYP